MENSRIEVLISSDSRYEKVTAELYCFGKFVALLNQDEGVDDITIEFPGANLDENMVLRNLDLATFEECLMLAKQRLVGLQR
ncbi:MAG: hypothetical protein QF512_15365 [Alphaproteobacteria bacterium]|jgi:hypothetical protein|nr:hypothetical protein [Alphaproteobacteria bacterium]